MGTIFDLERLWQNTFGYKPYSFAELPKRVEWSSKGTSLYGYKNGMEYFMPAQLGGQALPFPVVRISGQKTIVETPMVARRGTVKELIAIDDYKISIKGIIIDPDGHWPEAQIDALRKLYERAEALSLNCAFTNIFLGSPEAGGSDKVVITSLEFPECKGAKNVTGYSMELVSDQPFKLEEA